MGFLERVHNVHCVDGKMWGFRHYMSVYLVQGKKIALIEAGEPKRMAEVRAGINAAGFSQSDIAHLFITHCHQDHARNAAPLLKEMPKARVYVHPLGKQRLTAPASINWGERLSPAVQARRGEIEPVDPSRIQYLKDGDEFDLGQGEKLKIIFTPGHQPNGIVIFEEKNKGLFINDLVGNCFLDADCQYGLNPLDSDNLLVIEILEKLRQMPLSYLFLGHYGITDRCQPVIDKALRQLRDLLEIGRQCIREGHPELIAAKVLQYDMPEIENLRRVRGEELYRYASVEHIPFQSKLFANYCQKIFSDQRPGR